MSYTYVIIDTENRGDHLVRGKIGKSYNPRKRMTELQTGSSGRLRLLCALEGEEWEPLLQRAHRDWCVGGEWFAMDASYFLVIASLAEAQRGEYGVDEGAVSDLAVELVEVRDQIAERVGDGVTHESMHGHTATRNKAGSLIVKLAEVAA